MTKRIAPFFKPGALSRADADALNQLARDLYTIFGGFTGAAPISVRQDAGGVSISLLPVSPLQVAIIKVTSATTTSVTLASGTIQAYPAVLESLSGSGAWTDGTVVWLYPANAGFFAVNVRYVAVLVGSDTSGVQVWGAGGDMTCIGPFITAISCVGNNLVKTTKYLSLPIGSSLSDNSDCST
jgi:hypothetical protein